MKVVLIYSGGLDSTSLLFHLREEHEVMALGVDYGQRHRKELEAARKITAENGVPFLVADLSGLRSLLKGSSQTDASVPVPHGHYAEESMKQTVVPNRNMLMLAVGGAVAIAEGYDAVAIGCHAGDHAIYPDCRSAFTDALDQAFNLCDWRKLRLLAPFVHLFKQEIVRIGVHLGAPLADTWSCYEGGAVHCGKCGTCVERKEAFALAAVSDPTQYEA